LLVVLYNVVSIHTLPMFLSSTMCERAVKECKVITLHYKCEK